MLIVLSDWVNTWKGHMSVQSHLKGCMKIFPFQGVEFLLSFFNVYLVFCLHVSEPHASLKARRGC